MAIIAVYFGKLPSTISVWLTSCSYNPAFDWFVFTDADISRLTPPNNVKLRPLTLSQFCNRISQELGFEVQFAKPYKVCDFRPLFWLLLTPEPTAYDFWGHCDLDMIFGDLRAFITPTLFRNYDKIFSVGHLTLYRNTPVANQMYRRSHPVLDWRSILSDPAHRGFDEHIGINRIWKVHTSRVYQNENIIADIDPHYAALELVGPNANYRHQTFFFENGKVHRGYYTGRDWHTEEFMYIHFQKRSFITSETTPQPRCFYITPSGFVSRDTGSVPSRALVHSLNPIEYFRNVSELRYRSRRLARYLLLGN